MRSTLVGTTAAPALRTAQSLMMNSMQFGRNKQTRSPRLVPSPASAAASRLAQGAALIDAVEDAQAYTWETLARARDRGRGQWLPLRGPAKVFVAEGRRGQIG